MHWPALRPFARGRTDVATADDDPFSALRREMDRLVDSFGRDLGWPAAGPPSAMAPSIGVSETEGEIRIEADLPGVDQRTSRSSFADNLLTIKGEKKTEKEEKKKDYRLVERSYGGFARSIILPFAAEPDQADATFRNGVLTITLPKAAGDEGQGEEDRDQGHLTPARPPACGASPEAYCRGCWGC